MISSHDTRVPAWAVVAYAVGQRLVKTAATSPPLQGQLYAASTGWLLLSVPNPLAYGVFASLTEPGIELPPGDAGSPFTAHISVMRAEEVAAIGGPDGIKERGQRFTYTLDGLADVEPAGWPEMERVWFLRAESHELEKLRTSYGLSALPNNGKNAFHVSVAVRRRSVRRVRDPISVQ